MKAVHISDTHGRFPDLPDEAELVLHTGDFYPNFVIRDRELEAHSQRAWLLKHALRIHYWLKGRTCLVVQGNHDFASVNGLRMVPGLIDVTNRAHVHEGLTYYGFPFVPEFGPWNWGLPDDHLKAATAMIPEGVDVLMCHAPPHGVLDQCPGGNIGNPHLLPHLRRRNKLPKYLLCGHVHESGGRKAWHHDMQIVNSATTQRIIDL